ncbi:cytochrome P450 [Xylaria sp. FL1042]|nr:cytochrome P450 [Xylaria sp. FL1042]
MTYRVGSLSHKSSPILAFPVIGRRNERFSGVRTRLVKFTERNSRCWIRMLDRNPIVLLPTSKRRHCKKLPEDRLDVFDTPQQQIQAHQITRELNVVMPQMVTEIETTWKEVLIWKACFQVIVRATNAALCGASLCSNPEYLQCIDGWSTAFFASGTIISITLEFLRPITGFFVKLALRRNDDTQLSTDLVADRILITNNVTLQGMTFTVQHLLLIDPHGIKVEQADSTTILIPRGTILAVLIESIHYDNDIYPDSHKLNPFRFVIPQSESNDKGTPRSSTSTPATTADDGFFGFGTSKNPCPGRFLAVHEIKLILAHILRLPNILAMKVPKLDATIHVRRWP